MSSLEIVGRSSSHFTRLPLIFAHELNVPIGFVPIYDMTQLGPEVYAGNPALKLPILRSSESMLVGSQNICRYIAEHAPAPKRIVWPEELREEVPRNAQELVNHCMNVQVQLIFGTMIAKLPGDNLYFTKARRGLEGSLEWLETNLPSTLSALPPRDLSFFEASLFCLIDHLRFRETTSLKPYTALLHFAEVFGQRSSAQRTPYRIDTPPNVGR